MDAEALAIAEAEANRRANQKDDEGGTSGAVIFVIILLILLVIAGVLLFVFRKRLNLAEKCKKLGAMCKQCKCCNRKSS